MRLLLWFSLLKISFEIPFGSAMQRAAMSRAADAAIAARWQQATRANHAHAENVYDARPSNAWGKAICMPPKNKA
jgi:hypothetical protein